jgi:hypothetical protein
MHFETYELVIFLIFQFFFFWGGGCGKRWITETADTESADTMAQLHYCYMHSRPQPYTQGTSLPWQTTLYLQQSHFAHNEDNEDKGNPSLC